MIPLAHALAIAIVTLILGYTLGIVTAFAAWLLDRTEYLRRQDA